MITQRISHEILKYVSCGYKFQHRLHPEVHPHPQSRLEFNDCGIRKVASDFIFMLTYFIHRSFR
jgi:hypothetical protein